MITEVKLDQYRFYIDYSVESGDGYYSLDWIDWQCLGGHVCNEFDEILDSSQEWMQNEAELFSEWIDKLLKQEIYK
jgi:hypothetical protein